VGKIDSGNSATSVAFEIVVVRASSATTTPETAFPAWFVYEWKG
jgi:hypothetical protein